MCSFVAILIFVFSFLQYGGSGSAEVEAFGISKYYHRKLNSLMKQVLPTRIRQSRSDNSQANYSAFENEDSLDFEQEFASQNISKPAIPDSKSNSAKSYPVGIPRNIHYANEKDQLVLHCYNKSIEAEKSTRVRSFVWGQSEQANFVWSRNGEILQKSSAE